MTTHKNYWCPLMNASCAGSICPIWRNRGCGLIGLLEDISMIAELAAARLEDREAEAARAELGGRHG